MLAALEPPEPPPHRARATTTIATMYAIDHDSASPSTPNSGYSANASTMLMPFSRQLRRNGVRVSCIA